MRLLIAGSNERENDIDLRIACLEVKLELDSWGTRA
jgi:hypothetical protein